MYSKYNTPSSTYFSSCQMTTIALFLESYRFSKKLSQRNGNNHVSRPWQTKTENQIKTNFWSRIGNKPEYAIIKGTMAKKESAILCFHLKSRTSSKNPWPKSQTESTLRPPYPSLRAYRQNCQRNRGCGSVKHHQMREKWMKTNDRHDLFLEISIHTHVESKFSFLLSSL